jgi:hypothetical protein
LLSPLQVEAVCGDLYPTDAERRIILSSIQAYCGPPQPNKLNLPKGEIAYFNNWKCGDRIKHKGCAVGDLEKARRDPSSWGVSGVANHSGERPARPNRFIHSSLVPTLQSKVQKQDEPSQAFVQAYVVAGDGEPLGSREPLGDEEPPVDKGSEDEEPPAREETQQQAGEENRRQLDTEGDEQTSVLLMISEQQAALKAAQGKADAIKEAKKARQQASKGQRADKKTEHTAAKVGVIATHPIATHPIATHSITIFSAASCWQVPMPLHMISDAM